MRLFLAYDIDEDSKNFILKKAKDYKKKVRHARWIPAENMHITVKFLGDVETPDTIIHLINTLIKTQKILPPDAPLNLEQITAFPNPLRSRVLIGKITQSDQLTRNAIEIDKTLEGLGFEREKRLFVPHVTIARFKVPEKITETPLEEFHHEVHLTPLRLYRSKLTPQGAIYTIIHQFET